MKRLLGAFAAFACLTGSLHALPPAPVIHIERIDGTVLEVAREKDPFFRVVRLHLTHTTSPEETGKLYHTLRKSTRFPIQEYKRPKKGEVLLVLPASSVPQHAKPGDVLRITGFAIQGSDVSPKSASQPQAEKVELNPKN
jgi:hypothetical protein